MKKLCIVLVSILFVPSLHAQDVFTAQELEALRESLSGQVGSNNAAILDNIINEGGYFAAMVHREPGPGFSESHADWADLYFVTSGTASLITGGSIIDPTEADPGEVRGSGIEGGSRQLISQGDVVHIPVGVPHHVLVEAGQQVTYFIFKAMP